MAVHVDRAVIGAGVVLCLIYGIDQGYSRAASRVAREQFVEIQQSAPTPVANPDFGLWAESRISSYKRTLLKHVDPPAAMLRIRRIHLEVPVFEGTSNLVLNRGAGMIAGTARLDQNGNIGIAGHRDGFFRSLKDVVIGDEVELSTRTLDTVYTVDRLNIVDPSDVRALDQHHGRELTLVTCYPFYLIGKAPKRYIVQCSLKASGKGI